MREEIAERARRATGREDGVFYGRIVQIDFNAWHYVEANLWASLVEHLFRNLKLTYEKSGDEAIAKRREALLQKLDSLMATRVEAETRIQQAEIVRDQASQNLEARKKAAEASAAVVKGMRAQDIWDVVEIDPKNREALQQGLMELGVNGVLQSNEELRKTIDELRSVSSRGKLLTQWVAHQPRTLVLVLILILLVPFGAVTGVKLLQKFRPELAALSAAIVAYAGGVTTWLAKRLKTGNAILARIDAARQLIDEKVVTAEDLRQKAIKTAEMTLQSASAAVTWAKTDLESHEQEVADARKKLLELTNGYRLTRFIDERAASDDYRKLLGVLATVRNDFSTLSELMHPAEGMADVGEDSPLRIDRIILYIDDLDRCAPDRVVDVLQAVHLLLAFKLFVVVVGVDARWVSESLRQKHKALRGKQSHGSEDIDDENVPGYAVAPHDYLEKIFQVPFWLDPMQPQTTMSYISSLLAEDIERRGDPRLAPTRPSAGTPGAGSGGESQVQGTQTTAVWHTINDREGADTDPKQLTIDEKEMKYMTSKLIASLVTRSPRTAKRYVNTYRFFRASLLKEEIDGYLADATPPPYRCALLLLAIVVGTPDVSLEVLARMKKHPAKTTLDFAKTLSIGGEYSEQWKNVKSALTAFEQGECPLEPIIAQLPRVVRYSFRAPYAGTTTRKTPKSKPERAYKAPRHDSGSAQTPQQKGRPTSRPQ